MNEPISSIMIKDVYTVQPDQPISKVRDLFRDERIHHIPIIKEDRTLVGLITTSDLLWLNKSFDEYDNIPAKEVMSTKLAKLEPSAKIGTAAEIFLRNWFHALPVVDAGGKLLGLVTSFDVLKYNFRKEYPNETV